MDRRHDSIGTSTGAARNNHRRRIISSADCTEAPGEPSSASRVRRVRERVVSIAGVIVREFSEYAADQKQAWDEPARRVYERVARDLKRDTEAVQPLDEGDWCLNPGEAGDDD